MNKKLVLVLAGAAFVLAGCYQTFDDAVIWRQTTPRSNAHVIKHTVKDYRDQERTDLESVRVWYEFAPAGPGPYVEVEPCGSGFCDKNGVDVTKTASSDKLDKKNDSARRKTGGRGIAKTIYEDEPGVDGGGGG